MQQQAWKWIMMTIVSLAGMTYVARAQDTMNRHRIGLGVSYFMPHLDGQPLPGNVSPNRVSPILRYRYGKEEGWFVQAQWRGTRGNWPMGKPANFNVMKEYRGMQIAAGVGRYWKLRKQLYAVTIVDGSWDRYRSGGSFGGGITGLYERYNAHGNMMSAGFSTGVEYRLNNRWILSLDTRMMLGARAQVLNTTNPSSKSTFELFAYLIPVQGLMLVHRL